MEIKIIVGRKNRNDNTRPVTAKARDFLAVDWARGNSNTEIAEAAKRAIIKLLED